MHTDYTSKDVERFWSKVDLSKADEDFACWEWTASTSKGYGQIRLLGHSRYAHRIAHEFAFGKFSVGLDVLHHCDNPLCVNPNHLFLGTHTDNMRDMALKGRHAPPRGEKHWKHKLTDEQVAEIRQRYAVGGARQTELAAEYGVGQAQISSIVRRKSR